MNRIPMAAPTTRSVQSNSSEALLRSDAKFNKQNAADPKREDALTGFLPNRKGINFSKVPASSDIYFGSRGIQKDIAIGKQEDESLSTTAESQVSEVKHILSKNTIEGPSAGDCGKNTWAIQWVLNQPAGPEGGYVVQTVEIETDVKTCDEKFVYNKTYCYQEAWRIQAGRIITDSLLTGDLYDDAYKDPSLGDETKGRIRTTGVATYFDGLTLPDDFKLKNPDTKAFDIPSTTTIHAFSGGSPPIPHNLTADWDCCSGEKKETKLNWL